MSLERETEVASMMTATTMEQMASACCQFASQTMRAAMTMETLRNKSTAMWVMADWTLMDPAPWLWCESEWWWSCRIMYNAHKSMTKPTMAAKNMSFPSTWTFDVETRRKMDSIMSQTDATKMDKLLTGG